MIKAKPNSQLTDTTIDGMPSINNRPVSQQTIPIQYTVAGELLEYVIPRDTFTDADNDTLTLSVALSDSSNLPDWLEFNFLRSLLLCLAV